MTTNHGDQLILTDRESKNSVSSFEPPRKGKILIRWRMFSRGPPSCSGAGALALQGEAKGMSLLSLEKRQLQVDLAACQYLQAYQEDTARLFTLVHGEWTRDNGHKLKQDRF